MKFNKYSAMVLCSLLVAARMPSLALAAPVSWPNCMQQYLDARSRLSISGQGGFLYQAALLDLTYARKGLLQGTASERRAANFGDVQRRIDRATSAIISTLGETLTERIIGKPVCSIKNAVDRRRDIYFKLFDALVLFSRRDGPSELAGRNASILADLDLAVKEARTLTDLPPLPRSAKHGGGDIMANLHSRREVR